MLDDFMDEIVTVKDGVEKQVKKGANKLGFSFYGDDISRPAFDKVILGICYDCQNLQCVKTTWGNMAAKCYEFNMVLNPQDPVEHCTNYNKRGQLSLVQMIDMATPIDPEAKKRRAGFVIDDD